MKRTRPPSRRAVEITPARVRLELDSLGVLSGAVPASTVATDEPGKGGGGKKRRGKPEQQVQRAVLDYLGHEPTVAWAAKFGVGKFRVPDRSARGYRLVSFGFAGCADILGQLRDGRFLALEVKAGRGEATDAQKRFLDLVRRHGGVAGVVRSVDDARALVERERLEAWREVEARR